MKKGDEEPYNLTAEELQETTKLDIPPEVITGIIAYLAVMLVLVIGIFISLALIAKFTHGK